VIQGDWKKIGAVSGMGLQAQWQFRHRGRSIAAVRREEDNDRWVGIIIGPDNFVQDIEITGPATTNWMFGEVQRALWAYGWED
jgi:hypothetical protein